MKYLSFNVLLRVMIALYSVQAFHRLRHCRLPSIRSYSKHIIMKSTASDEITGVANITTEMAYSTTSQLLSRAVTKALGAAFGDSVASDADAMIFPGKADFGDYQCNVAMPLAKKLKMKPRDIAERVVKNIEDDPAMMNSDSAALKSLDISGPGFINMHLADEYINDKLESMLESSQYSEDVDGIHRLGIPRTQHPQRIVVDYSSPNIAKEMHVGHLRSTIIGDCLSNVLEYLGHDVLRLNHVGDWGTQFGMLIHYLKTHYGDSLGSNSDGSDGEFSIGMEIKDLAEFYKSAKKEFDSDNQFQEAARQEVVKLQAGDKESVRAWKTICELSRREFQLIYDRLNIRNLQERGESFYNPMLGPIVSRLSGNSSTAVAQVSEGALCIFLDGFVNGDGTPLPLIIQKSDGGYLYATTDLAALQHRVMDEKADRIIYVTDAGQAQHFNMVFAAGRKAGILNADSKVELTHVPFGLVQGEDGKKIKSRAGDSIKLGQLLDEAIARAEEQFLQRNEQQIVDLANDDQDTKVRRARIMGIGAVKYADLSMNRESNYKFSFDKMLSLNGNTAPYMLYAYVRILGIQRKAAEILQSDSSSESLVASNFELQEKAELNLAKHLIRFEEIVHEVARDLYPNKLCDYIFELSQKFNQFYENCPVIKAPTSALLKSRYQLCTITADTLRTSLCLLGIETVDRL